MASDNGDKLYLGFDISTQQVKVIIINDMMKTVYQDGVNFDTDLSEFNTEGGAHVGSDNLTVTSPTVMWVKAVDVVLDQMKKAGVDFKSIIALSGAGQQHGSVYWRKGAREILSNMQSEKSMFEQLSGPPICFSIENSPIWMDSSTTKQCQTLENLIGGPEEVAKITGSKAYERFTGNQIAKVYQQYQAAFKDTERISLVSSFGASLFVGDYAPIDFADGSGMNLMSIQSKMWAKKCLEACAPSLDALLAKPVASDTIVGKVSSYLVDRYGFNPNCDVVAFTGDNPASLAGMRLKKGDVAVSLGTSDTLFLWLTEPNPATEGHIFVNPVDSSAYMAMLCYKNGSLTREKIRNSVADSQWSTFDKYMESSPKGNNGNLGMYFDIAEITPTNALGYYRFNKEGKPVDFFSKEEEVRALVEGQFLAKRVHAENLGYSIASGNSRIFATGGASANTKILQVLADVFNLPVYVLDVPNSASLGSAYRAKHGHFKGDGISFYDAVMEAPDFICVAKPDQETKELYDTLTKRYKNLENKFVRQMNKL